MALGQALAFVIRHQPAVIPGRVVEPKGPVEQNLARGGLEQILPAHHLGDAHRRIVHYAGELVTRSPVPPPRNEVAKVAARHKPLRSQIAVDELDGLAVGHTKAPVDAFGRNNARWLRRLAVPARAASAGINRFVVESIGVAASRIGWCALMRRTQCRSTTTARRFQSGRREDWSVARWIRRRETPDLLRIGERSVLIVDPRAPVRVEDHASGVHKRIVDDPALAAGIVHADHRLPEQLIGEYPVIPGKPGGLQVVI